MNSTPAPPAGPNGAQNGSDGLWHGAELDEAMRAAARTRPDQMGVAAAVVDERRVKVIDEAFVDLADPELEAQTRRELVEMGVEFDEELLRNILLRKVIGGAFTFGLAAGLVLAGMPNRAEENAAREGAGRA